MCGGQWAWPTPAVAAQETFHVAVSTNLSFTRLSRCYSFSPHLTVRFGSILSRLPKPSSCPRNLSQFVHGQEATPAIRQGSVHICRHPTPPISHLNCFCLPHWNLPHLLAISAACDVIHRGACPFCTATSTPKYLRTFAKFGWRIVTRSRSRCSVGKANDAPL